MQEHSTEEACQHMLTTTEKEGREGGRERKRERGREVRREEGRKILHWPGSSVG